MGWRSFAWGLVGLACAGGAAGCSFDSSTHGQGGSASMSGADEHGSGSGVDDGAPGMATWGGGGDGEAGATSLADAGTSTTGEHTGPFASGTSGAVATSGASSTTGPGGTGTSGPGSGDNGDTGESDLVDRGLVVRYFLDEAESGTTPPTVFDAATEPLDVPLVYDAEMTYRSVDGQRGLHWKHTLGDGRAERGIAGTKVGRRLHGRNAVTFEAVVRVVDGVEGRSRIIALGTQFDPMVGISATSASALRFYVASDDDVAVIDWATEGAAQRVVLHVVYDSAASAPEQRVVLYVDGVYVSPSAGIPPTQGLPIALEEGAALVLGNRQDGDRSFAGELFYAAIYDVALTPAEITNNVERLQVSDDT